MQKRLKMQKKNRKKQKKKKNKKQGEVKKCLLSLETNAGDMPRWQLDDVWTSTGTKSDKR